MDLPVPIAPRIGWRAESRTRRSWERWANRGAELDERAWRVTEAYLSRPAKLLRSNRAAWRLERLGYGRDVDFCLAEDTAPAVPRLVGDAFVGGRS